jgi:hypothetical protein
VVGVGEMHTHKRCLVVGDSIEKCEHFSDEYIRGVIKPLSAGVLLGDFFRCDGISLHSLKLRRSSEFSGVILGSPRE